MRKPKIMSMQENRENSATLYPKQVHTIKIESEPDPTSNMFCCGQRTVQRQIDYKIIVNNELFKVPKVWASVCDACNEPYFAPEIGTTIQERIFETQHPVESKIAKLLGQ